jgi:hypothetical protein
MEPRVSRAANKLLAVLRDEAYERIARKLRPTHLQSKQILYKPTHPSVSEVLEDFRIRGMLTIERGRVLLGDRNRLLTVACDCYEIIRKNYEQVGR